MDSELVKATIRERAGKPDLAKITEVVSGLRERFFKMRESAISILTASTIDRDDSFLKKKLEQVETLQAPESSTIALSLLPKGQVWSRDSLAVSQGLQVAPHQRLIGLHLAATVLRNGIDTLERVMREAASHLKRVETRKARAAMVGTNVFIGHGRSPQWRELKDFVEDRLKLPADEFNSTPVAGVTTTARLSELLDAAAFALLVMTAEDEQVDGSVRARENVVHEVGLFQGRLGFSRAIVLLEEGCEEFSNIHGLGQIRFPKGRISAIFEDIRAVLEREGLVSPPL
jgi:predicted nucleotide-binding protein